MLRKPLGCEYRYHQSLTNDMAICGPGEYLPGESPLPYTQTFAMDYGWRWRVCIQTRTGNGYAFNSKMISVEKAREEFIRKTPGLKQEKIFVVPIRNGYNPEPWKHNVISFGLSCGFLEPLEATGLFLIHGPVMLFEKLLNDPNASIKYNKIWSKLYRHIAEFLSYQYETSKLNHTEYWNQFKKTNLVKLPKTKTDIFDAYNYRIMAKARRINYE